MIHLSSLIHYKHNHIYTRSAVFAVALMFVCLFAFAENQPASPIKKTKMSSPQVLILVWAGMGWADMVNINYDSPVSEKSVREDITAISQSNGWAVNNLRITTKKISVPDARVSTSATFFTNTNLASGLATVNIDPIVLAYKRLDRIQICYLVGKSAHISAPNGYTDDKVSIAGLYNPGNIQYAVQILDHTIMKLDWPSQQTGSAVPQTHGRNAWSILLIVMLASIGAAAAYFVAKKLTGK